MGTVATSDASAAPYMAVPVTGLVAKQALPFPLFLCTANNTWVLYRPTDFALDESHVGRLQAEGITRLFIRDADRSAYFSRVESSLNQILLDRDMPLDRRSVVLYGVAKAVAEDLLRASPDRAAVQRAQKVVMATSGLLLRETQAFAAIRTVMSSSEGLAQHSLTVSFLAMGLARNVLGADAGTLLWAGLAGLLHDVGKVGHEDLDHDPEHTTRGADYLRGLGLPAGVIDAVRSHHERSDGSGFPQGQRGAQIPDLACVVGLADTFDKIYSAKQPRVGVFDALRILAQAYRGCFEDRFTQGLVKLFR
ncbi:MAG: HD domain-containing protein [Planctomycetota bacterium]